MLFDVICLMYYVCMHYAFVMVCISTTNTLINLVVHKKVQLHYIQIFVFTWVHFRSPLVGGIMDGLVELSIVSL